MRREVHAPRAEYLSKVEHLGLVFHTIDGEPYWNEAASYRFEPEEIEVLESSTNELHQMCLAAVEHVIEHRLFDLLAIPPQAHDVITRAWEVDPPAIYGRFDLAYDGVGPPKLLEYNADTPTSLLEAAVVQWHWLQEVHPTADQFNSIWEGLLGKWRALKEEGYLKSGRVHFACMDSEEDLMTTAVLMDTAHEAGINVELMSMEDIAWNQREGTFVDKGHERIETLFKLYPWEWMLKDRFGPVALRLYGNVQWIEPIWKMILSNKGILAILWEMFPEHPNLLPAFSDGPHDMIEYVRKPFLGREGANVEIVQGDRISLVEGPYGDGPLVYQEYSPLPSFDENHAVVGSWVIDGNARGIGVRESSGPITQNLARFVPHYFLNPSLENVRENNRN